MNIEQIEEELTTALFEVRQKLPVGLGLAVKVDELPGLIRVRLKWKYNWHPEAAVLVGVIIGTVFGAGLFW